MNSAQLDLWEGELDALPWRGKSPRGLTRGRKLLFFRREPQKSERFFVDPEQYELFPAAKRRPLGETHLGAPLLIEPGGYDG